MRVELIGHLFQDTYIIALHSHQCWEYGYYTSGCGTVYMNDEAIPFKAGELFIIPPGVVHGEHAEGGFQNYHCSVSSCNLKTKSYIRIEDRDHSFLTVMEGMHREYHLQRNTGMPSWMLTSGIHMPRRTLRMRRSEDTLQVTLDLQDERASANGYIMVFMRQTYKEGFRKRKPG